MKKISKNRKKNHKKLVTRRKTRQNVQKEADLKTWRDNILKSYAGGSRIFPLSSLIDTLARQKILQSESFQETQIRVLDWFDSGIEAEARTEQATVLNYLPDKVVSFLIPLDFYLPLPENYNSTFVTTSNNEVLEANCVTNTTRIVHVGKSAIKVTYLVVSLCSNSAAKDVNLKTPKATMRNFERAIVLANAVIGSFQAIPSRHNHHLHQITSFSCPSKLEFFIFNRRTKQVLRKGSEIVRDNLFSDAFQSRSVDPNELRFYQNCYVLKNFEDDKVFKLISILNQATNARCFGHNDDSILYSDKFVCFSLGYLYCEIRILRGEDRKKVYEEYKNKEEKDILKELKELLEYRDLEKFKVAIGYDDWYDKCRSKRNELSHRFLSGGFNGKESGEALYQASEIVRRTCEIIISTENEKHSKFIEKVNLLLSATLFPKNMHEVKKETQEKFLSRVPH